MEDSVHGGERVGFTAQRKETDNDGADSTSTAPETGPSSPESDRQQSRTGSQTDGAAPDGVVCWPSPRAVEECERPVRVGTDQVSDPVTGEVKGERKVLKACGSSRCEACRERRRRQLIAHFTEQFWSAKRLRFVTLTLDKAQLRREGITTDEERKAYLARIWSLLVGRLNRRCGRVRFYKVIDRDDSDGWHIHAVMAVNVPERVLRWHWFDVGGGCVMDCQPLRTPSQVTDQQERAEAEKELARAFGYIVYKAQHVDGARAHPSQGDGYSSDAAVEKRKRNAQSGSGRGRAGGNGSGGNAQDSTSAGESLDTSREPERSDRETAPISVEGNNLNSREEVLEAVKSELRSAVGEWVRLSDGTKAKLLKVSDRLTVKEKGADRTRTDVRPFDVDAQVPDIHEFIPMSRPTHAEAVSRDQKSGQVLSDERFERVRQSMRKRTYIGTDEDGSRVRWTYDRESQEVRSEKIDQ